MFPLAAATQGNRAAGHDCARCAPCVARPSRGRIIPWRRGCVLRTAPAPGPLGQTCAMSASAAHSPAQQARRASLQPPQARGGAPGSSSSSSGAAAAPVTIKPFKICKEAAAERRRAERQALYPSAATLRQEEFGVSRPLPRSACAPGGAASLGPPCMVGHGEPDAERAIVAGCVQSANGVRTIRSSPSGGRRSRQDHRGQRSGRSVRTLRAAPTWKRRSRGI